MAGRLEFKEWLARERVESTLCMIQQAYLPNSQGTRTKLVFQTRICGGFHKYPLNHAKSLPKCNISNVNLLQKFESC